MLECETLGPVGAAEALSSFSTRVNGNTFPWQCPLNYIFELKTIMLHPPCSRNPGQFIHANSWTNSGAQLALQSK